MSTIQTNSPQTNIGGGGGGGGSSAFGDITDWPGASTDFVRGDGTDSPLSAADIPNHSAALLTSGTVPAARLVAANMPQKRTLVAVLASGQTVNGLTKLTFDTPTNDGALTWSGNTGTATRDMTVSVDLTAYSSANPTVFVNLIIYKNGSAHRYGTSTQSIAAISKSINLVSNDTIEIYANAATNCALNVTLAGLRELQITEL